MSRRLAVHRPSPAIYIRSSTAPRPRPRRPSSAWSPELWDNEAAAAAASGGCDSRTGAIDGRRRGFHDGIYLKQARAAAIKKERGAHPGGLEGQPPGTSPPPAVSGSRGPGLPTPPLPRFPLSLSPPARAGQTLTGLFREGVWVCPWRRTPFTIHLRKRICCS